MDACCFDETVKLLKQICISIVYVYVRDYLKGEAVWYVGGGENMCVHVSVRVCMFVHVCMCLSQIM